MKRYQEAQLKLYYFLMNADGVSSNEEKKLFSEICTKMNITDDDKKSIITACFNASTDSEGYFNKDVLVESSKAFWKEIKYSINYQRETIWNLINIAYADENFCDAELEFIELLMENSNVEKHVFDSFIDCAETMLALNKKKSWLKTTALSYDEVTEKISKIDQDIEQITKSISLMINDYV